MADNIEIPEDPILVQMENLLLQIEDEEALDAMKVAISLYKEGKSMKPLCDKKPEFMYILIEFKYLNSRKAIVKIGKTVRSVIDRFKEYPKGSVLLGSAHVQDCNLSEKILISEFCKLYKRRLDIGLEYFQGIISDMENTFYETILKIRKIEKILETNVSI